MARIDDGHSTRIHLAGVPNQGGTLFWEKKITPPAMDGGGPNDTTTMRNQIFRSKAPKKLITMDTMRLTVSFDPAIYAVLSGIINYNTVITVIFPDDTGVKFWGWLDKFTPNAFREGEQPTAEIVIECSNRNETTGELEGPTYLPPGTVPVELLSF